MSMLEKNTFKKTASVPSLLSKLQFAQQPSTKTAAIWEKISLLMQAAE